MANISAMDALLIEHLVRLRPFPPVVHPRHAREVLTGGEAQSLTEWTAGYALTLPEHRAMLEELLASLAWKPTGRAVLVNGLYGTGKSHLLVLLHLLAALPAAWEPFLGANPTLQRYAQACQKRRWQVIHFSLDEYGPQISLEDALREEIRRATPAPLPAAFTESPSRYDAWMALLAALREWQYDGLLLLVDEVSLFLAAKSPARREGDAAFLQFLAGWTARAPVWMIGAMQRNLADVGALRTHSWRQVEDRFQRYTLLPQEIGRALCGKLLQRSDPAALRALLTEQILPVVGRAGLTAGALQMSWPFHPAAVDLLMTVVNGYLSPHRSAVEILQGMTGYGWLSRPAARLITPVDLYPVLLDDLQRDTRLSPLWQAVHMLEEVATAGPDPDLAAQALHVLALLHLAERCPTVAELCTMLCDGERVVAPAQLSPLLHHLRRHGAYLVATREADPGAEVFTLAVEDDAGALALERMQELRAEFTPADPRIAEFALRACTDAAWPWASAQTEDGVRLPVPWGGGERMVQVSLAGDITPERLARSLEGVEAGLADACVLLGSPGARETLARPPGDSPYAAGLLVWQPRPPHAAEWELWAEYTAWQQAAEEPGALGTPRERRAQRRCRERAEELRPAVEASVRAVFCEGAWADGRGGNGLCPAASSLTECLAVLLTPGFAALFPGSLTFAPHGAPPRAVLQQLLSAVIMPGSIVPAPRTLLEDAIQRYLAPLGCVEHREAGSIHGMDIIAPAWELIAPIFTRAVGQPLTFAEATAILRRPPLGLPEYTGQLVLAVAIRSGALLGLDAFLQPLTDPTTVSADAGVAFLAAPSPLEETIFGQLVHRLAERWRLPAEPWPLACALVDRHLLSWVAQHTDLPAMRETIREWTEVAQGMPWMWRASEGYLETLERMHEARSAYDRLCRLSDNVEMLIGIERLQLAQSWWRALRARIVLLLALPAGDARQALRECLAQGEAGLQEPTELNGMVNSCWTAYEVSYRQWHEQLFGAQAVAALRQVFDAPAFRVVKLLVRLPLPASSATAACLQALAQARAGYCPQEIRHLSESDGGCCPRCRRSLGSPSPMPDPTEVIRQAQQALIEFGDFLTSAWADTVRQRLVHAPDDMRASAEALLAWQHAHGPEALATLLTEPFLAWLCRDAVPAGARRVTAFTAVVQGRELTLAEVRTAFQAWADPTGELGDDAVLHFTE